MSYMRFSALLLILAGWGVAAVPAAAEWRLDPAFGGGGVRRTGLQTDPASGVAVLAQDDNLVVAAVDAGLEPEKEIYLARFAPNGRLDPSFGTGGVARTGLPAHQYGPVALAQRDDGGLLVAGVHDMLDQSMLVRFTADGEVDASYGTGGVAYSGVPAGVFSRVDLELLADGSALLAGVDEETEEAYLARFTADGALDPTFGVLGIRRTGVPTDHRSDVAVTVQPSGKPVLVTHDAVANQFFMTRFHPGGVVDQTFGTAGTTLVGIESYFAAGVGLIQRSNGTLTVSGTDEDANEDFVAVFTAGGAPVTSFGTNGVAYTGRTTFDAETELVALADGGVVLASSDVSNHNYLARFKPGGALDSAFGDAGTATSRVEVDLSEVRVGVAVDDSGAIALVSHDGPLGQTFVAVFTGDGLEVPAGPDGVARAPMDSDEHAQVAAAPVPAGGTYLAGRAADESLVLTRFNASGALDGGFGTAGQAATPVAGTDESGIAIALQSTDKPVVASIEVLSDTAYMSRFDTTGALDTTFGAGGVAYGPTLSSATSGIDLLAQNDDTLVLAGIDTNTEPFLSRFLPDGSVDASFGAAGIAKPGLAGWFTGGVATAVMPDGDLLLAGIANQLTTEAFVARFNPDGTLESAFGSGGVAYSGIDGGTDVWVDVAAQPDGSVLLASVDDDSASPFVARLTTAGVLDASFGVGGIAHGPPATPQGRRVRIGLQPDGGILLSSFSEPHDQVFVIRFTADGAVDPAFATLYPGVTSTLPAGLDLLPVGNGALLLAAVDESLTESVLARFVEPVFLDGFESGDVSAWSSAVP